MSTTTSGSCFIQVQATMLSMGVGLFLLGYAYSAHAAKPVADPFAPGIDVFKFQLAHFDNLQQSDYRPDTRARLAGTPSIRTDLIETSGLPGYINPDKKIASWIASILWNLDAVGDRASLSPHLRVQSKETLIEVKPLDQSFVIVWRKALD